MRKLITLSSARKRRESKASGTPSIPPDLVTDLLVFRQRAEKLKTERSYLLRRILDLLSHNEGEWDQEALRGALEEVRTSIGISLGNGKGKGSGDQKRIFPPCESFITSRENPGESTEPPFRAADQDRVSRLPPSQDYREHLARLKTRFKIDDV